MGTFSAPTSVGTGTSTTNNTTVTITTSNAVPAGSLIVCAARFNTTQTAGSCTVTDSASNTYTVRNSGSVNEIWVDSLTTADLAASSTMTFTGTANATAKVAIAQYFSGPSTSPFGSGVFAVPFFQGTARNVSGNTVSPTAIGDLVVGMWSLDTTETSMSASTGYTIGPTWTGTGYYAANGLSLSTVYQIVSSVGATEPKGTGGVSPSAYGATGLWYKAAFLPPLVVAPPLAP